MSLKMNTLKVVAIVPILILLAACGSSQDESFAFDQETLSVIDNKLHEFEGVEKQAQGEAIHPVLVANLLDGGIAYDDTRPADVRDSTCRERFIPSKLSGQGSRQTDIYRITFSYDSRAVNHILLIHRGEMTFSICMNPMKRS